jgi:hypothetical protein
MNPIGIIFQIFLLICSGQEYEIQANNNDIRAKTLNDSAVSLLFTFESNESIEKAFSLFDSSLNIQSDYFPAQCNKLTADLMKRNRIQSIMTLKKLEIERPHNPDIKLMLGILMLTTNDSSLSRFKFMEADTLYIAALQGVPSQDFMAEKTLRNYAINLKMLGNDTTSNDILIPLEFEQNHQVLTELIEILTKNKGSDLRKELGRAR